ncbi:GIP [Symbiodinium sp. CCMP2592]|nr:GIP [Symbiodinium sp. CCMP2592]
MCPGLLDFDGDGRIYRDRFLILCDALPRRAEIFALADLSQHLVKTYGSLPDAYAAFANISGEEVSPSNKKAKAAAEAGRRASFAF